MNQRPHFGVRADHDARFYEVYEIATGKTIERFPYKRGELNRGVAHGRANATREDLNRKESRQ